MPRSVQLMRLQGADHVILWSEITRIVARRHARDPGLPGDEQRQAAIPDRPEMLAAGDDADVAPGTGQFHGHVSADGSRAEDADLHGSSSGSDNAARPAACRASLGRMGREDVG